MLSENKRRYYRECLQASLQKEGFNSEKTLRITAAFEKRFQHLSILDTLPVEMFDMGRSVRILSRREKKEPWDIRKNIEKYIDEIFELYDITLPPKPVEEQSTLPASPEESFENVFFNALDDLVKRRGDKIPPHLLQKLIKKRDHFKGSSDGAPNHALNRIFSFVVQGDTVEPEQKPVESSNAATKVKKFIPDDTTLMEAMYQHKKHHGSLPKDGTDFLPEHSYNWTAIASSLRKRGYSIRLFFKTNTHEAGLQAPDWPKGKKPSPDDIQGKALTRYIQEKDMPLRPLIPRAPKPEQPMHQKRVKAEMPNDAALVDAIHKYYREARKMPTNGRHKLDDKNPSWPAIIASLRQQGTTLTNFYRDHISLLPEDEQAEAAALLSPRRAERTNAIQKTIPDNDVLLAAALAVRAEKKRLPDGRDKYEHLPENSYGWAHIRKNVSLPKLVSRHDRKMQRAEEKEKLGDARIHASQVFRTALSHYNPRRGFNGTAAEMDTFFRHKRVDGLDSIFDEARAKKIKTTEDFLKATGVITKNETGNYIPDPVLIQTFKTAFGL